MTEGYRPPAAPPASPDQETTTLPHLPPAGSPGGSGGSGGRPASGGWSAPASSRPPSVHDDDSASGLAARIAASAAATATTAKDALKTAANSAEAKATRPGRGGRGARQPRRARLTLSHINVYSVFKFSCVLSIALFLVWLIMVGLLYGALDVTGVFAKVNKTVHTITGDNNAKDVVTGSLVFGAAIIIGAVNIVLFIAMSTIGSMVYNLCADLVGGTEVTLSERE
jgi:hypothetical protein